MCWNERKLLSCDATAARESRRFCEQVIAACLGRGRWVRPLVDDACLISSEMVTNSVAAGCTTLSLSVTIHREWLRLDVFDNAQGMPRIAHTGPEAFDGRGLTIVAALSSAWGFDAAPTGKQTWADLSMPLRDVSAARVWCLQPTLTRSAAVI